MLNMVTELSKYLLLILIALYTVSCFSVFKTSNQNKQEKIYSRQSRIMFLIHFVGFLVIVMNTQDVDMVIFYGFQVLFLVATILLFTKIYPKSSRLIINNMCMCLVIGFIMLTRINPARSISQFQIVVVAMIIALIVPWAISKISFLPKLTWFYGILGLGLLLVVKLLGRSDYGANLAIDLGPIRIQPAEFVKIIFVFFIAGLLSKAKGFKDIVIATVMAAVHVLVLVFCKDLGAALIFFVAYLVMLYVATSKIWYVGAGLLAGSAAAVVAYKLFDHIRIRVSVWKDPIGNYHNSGQQVAQSLFAIGTGGWFGMGLYKGMPNLIPVREEDFIISVISEELGVFFTICLLLICASCFIMFANIAMQIKNSFYRLAAIGLGSIYAFQVFLTVGGAIKFIPSTGVTLPLISAGGSSALSTLIMFSIIQGLYILRENEEDKHERP